MNMLNNRYRHLSKRHYSMAIAALLAAVVLIVGCGGSNKNAPANSNAGLTNATSNQSPITPQGAGSFKYQYDPVTSPEHAKLREDAMKARVLETIAVGLNQELIIPVDITITMVECGVANAYYYPDKKRINMCYELLDHFYEIFRPVTKSEEELHRAVYGATAHTFFHELGHALIDVLELPATGKEEDAVDQLSTFILVNGGEEGEMAVINGANAFLLESQTAGRADELPFWDEHSLNEQRFYNLLCWVYGHNMEKYQYLVTDGNLPENRAGRCQDEYVKLSRSWLKLLGPYMKHRPPER